ncbi:hypothetical protein PSA5_30955 [Pseudomonas syringae pv. actinidiae]|nr:hypothetical protein PSA5_30955 [Pseudomonas syringae pv. actinidiae]
MPQLLAQAFDLSKWHVEGQGLILTKRRQCLRGAAQQSLAIIHLAQYLTGNTQRQFSQFVFQPGQVAIDPDAGLCKQRGYLLGTFLPGALEAFGTRLFKPLCAVFANRPGLPVSGFDKGVASIH